MFGWYNLSQNLNINSQSLDNKVESVKWQATSAFKKKKEMLVSSEINIEHMKTEEISLHIKNITNQKLYEDIGYIIALYVCDLPKFLYADFYFSTPHWSIPMTYKYKRFIQNTIKVGRLEDEMYDEDIIRDTKDGEIKNGDRKRMAKKLNERRRKMRIRRKEEEKKKKLMIKFNNNTVTKYTEVCRVKIMISEFMAAFIMRQWYHHQIFGNHKFIINMEFPSIEDSFPILNDGPMPWPDEPWGNNDIVNSKKRTENYIDYKSRVTTLD